MKSVTLTESFLRALGAGVQDMYEGDPIERSKAEEVVVTMKRLGFSLVGRKFVSILQVIVWSHFHEEGEDFDKLTLQERSQILAQVGVRHWDVQNPQLVEQLAYSILSFRQTGWGPRKRLELQ